jgi:hypothetical protein
MRNDTKIRSRKPRRAPLALATLCASFLALGGGVSHAATYGLGSPSSFGGAGELRRPTGVAVDQSNGNVFIADTGNARVSEFDSSGAFVRAWGWGVADGEAQFEICTSACQSGIPGGGDGQFQNLFEQIGAAGAAVDPITHDVYVTDQYINNRVQYFDSSGEYLGQFNGADAPATLSGPKGVVVDSSSNVYVADTGHQTVDKFTSSGAYECQITGKAAPSATECNGVSGSATPQEGFSLGGAQGGNLAIDPNGDLYVADAGNGVVDEFNASGAYVRQFSSGSDTAVAVDASGDVFATREGTHVQEFDPSSSLSTPVSDFGAGTITASRGLAINNSTGSVYVPDFSSNQVWNFIPIITPTCSTDTPPANITSTSATVPGTINPNGSDTLYSFEYGLDTSYSAGTTSAADAGTGTSDVPVTGSLSGLEPNATYHYQLRISFGSTSACGDQMFTTQSAKPSVDGESSSGVTQTDATLQAQINPNNQPTTYQFQYGTDTNYAGGTVPVSPGSVGSGFGEQPASAQISGALAPNTTYHFRVVATNATGATAGPDQTMVTLPATPTTYPASSITQTEATLSGTLNPGGIQSSYRFRYGATTSYGQTTAPADAGAGTNPVIATASLAALTPLTVYHYQLIVTTIAGSSASADRTFTTLPLPPGVYTGPAGSVGTTVATVHGSVDPHGADTTYHIEYGTTEAYGARTPDVDSGTAAQPVSTALGGLNPDTTYHYRLIATNSGGTTEGQDQTFTTNAAGAPGSSPLPAGFSLTGTAPAGPAAAIFPTLAGFTPVPPPKAATIPKALTNAQKLSRALRACKKNKSKAKRAKCDKEARKKYGTKAKSKK